MSFSFPILNKQSLAEKVELLVHSEHMRYSEAVIHVCEQYNIDPADIAALIITSPLKVKIENESIRLHTIKSKKKHKTQNTLIQ